MDTGSITQLFDTQGNRLKRLDANGIITERIDLRPYWFGESFLHPKYEEMLRYLAQYDFVPVVPVHIVDGQGTPIRATRERGRELNPVVVGVRLFAEDGNVIAVGRLLE